MRRQHLIVVVEPLIAFLPSLGSLTAELFAKILTNQRVSIERPGILRIFGSEESRSPQSGKNRAPFAVAQIGQRFCKGADNRRSQQGSKRLFVSRPIKKT